MLQFPLKIYSLEIFTRESPGSSLVNHILGDLCLHNYQPTPQALGSFTISVYWFLIRCNLCLYLFMMTNLWWISDLSIFSALLVILFFHILPPETTFTFRQPFRNYSLNFLAHQVLFQLTMIVNVVPQLVRLGTPQLFFFYYFDHLLVYSI